MAEIARLFIEDVFHLSPPRGLVVKGRIEGVFDSGLEVDLVRATGGQRVRCRVGEVYVLGDSTDHASLGLEDLPPDVSPAPGDVREGARKS